ncbi:UDP-3-O-(3-hydroxymyristoyl)glucosamine N-acyltransferase [Hydrogenimonas sp.]
MKLSDLAKIAGIDYKGKEIEIEGIGTLEKATPSQISFLDNPKYLESLDRTNAGAVILAKKYADRVPESTIPLIDEEPYLKLAYISALFAPSLMKEEGEPPLLKRGCRIGENVSFGKDVVVGERVMIMPGCSIGDDVIIGDDTIVHPNVTIYHGCEIGKSCIIHSGTVIGSDGFGFAHTKTGEHVKLYQLGNVVVEDDVEIGANCTIDRGAIDSTIIRHGTKIDNLVHIAHNCDIGEHCIIVGQAGISGSTTLERNVVMGGQSGTAGHLKIGAFATIAARGGVTKSIPGGKVYAGFPLMEHKRWLRLNAMLSRLLEKKS